MFNCKYCEYSFKCGKKITCKLYDNQEVTKLSVDERLCLLEPMERYVERLIQYVHQYPEGTRIRDLKFDGRGYIKLVDVKGEELMIKALDAIRHYGDVLVLSKTYDAYYIKLLI